MLFLALKTFVERIGFLSHHLTGSLWYPLLQTEGGGAGKARLLPGGGAEEGTGVGRLSGGWYGGGTKPP